MALRDWPSARTALEKQLEIKTKSKKQQQALPPDNTPATTAPQVESNTIPALPEEQYPDRAKDAMKLLGEIQKKLHEVRVISSVEALPEGHTIGDKKAEDKSEIEKSLYFMVDGLLYSAWHAIKAGTMVRAWKA